MTMRQEDIAVTLPCAPVFQNVFSASGYKKRQRIRSQIVVFHLPTRIGILRIHLLQRTADNPGNHGIAAGFGIGRDNIPGRVFG